MVVATSHRNFVNMKRKLD